MFPYGSCVQMAVYTGLTILGAYGLLLIVYGGILFQGVQSSLDSWYDPTEMNHYTNLHFDLVDDFSDMTVDNVLATRAALLILSGMLIFCYASLGMNAISKGSLKMLVWTALLMLLSISVDYVLFGQFYDLKSDVHKSAAATLSQNLRKVFAEDKEQQKYWNSIMFVGECCGINGAGDFMFNTGVMNISAQDALWLRYSMPAMYPPACCKKALLRHGDEEHDCYYTSYPTEIFDKFNKQGCYSAIQGVFGFSSVYIVIFAIGIVVQIIQVFLCSTLYFTVKYNILQAEEQNEVEEYKEVFMQGDYEPNYGSSQGDNSHQTETTSSSKVDAHDHHPQGSFQG